MKSALCLIISFIIASSVFYLIFWVGEPIALFFSWPEAGLKISYVVAALVTLCISQWFWKQSDSFRRDMIHHVSLGATVLGCVGFVGGYFGPLIFAPEANQGPLLGIFITGPLGIIIGGMTGGTYYMCMKRK